MRAAHRTVLAIVLLVGFAGCLGVTPAADSDRSPTTSTECTRSYPEPPDQPTNTSALSFADEYESTYAYNLVCHEAQFGIEQTTVTPKDVVELRTDSGVFVFIRQPYWSEQKGDAATSGVYYVGTDRFTRLSYYKAEMRTPAVNDSGQPNTANATHPSIRLFNFADVSSTVTVRYNDTASDAEWSTRTTVNETTGAFLTGLPVQAGAYHLVVTDETGETHRLNASLQPGGETNVGIYNGPTGEVHLFEVEEY